MSPSRSPSATVRAVWFWAKVVLAALAIACLVRVDVQLSDAQEEARAGKSETMKNRAQICRINHWLGAPAPDDCLAQRVLQFWDPGERIVAPTSEGTKTGVRILCSVLDAVTDDPLPPECTKFGP